MFLEQMKTGKSKTAMKGISGIDGTSMWSWVHDWLSIPCGEEDEQLCTIKYDMKGWINHRNIELPITELFHFISDIVYKSLN
jgi:hypothetical protein